MLNIDAKIRTPYHQMPITMVLKSIDRKIYRDQYCIECGRPFMAISDKYVSIIDGSIRADLLRDTERLIEARCKGHTCKQYYQVYV